MKTHLQAKANVATLAVGHQHEHVGMVPALTGIYRKFGIPGLFRGLSSTYPRIIVASAVQLSTFEKSLGILQLTSNIIVGVVMMKKSEGDAKYLFSEFVRSRQYVSTENRWGSAFLASILSGFFVSCAMAPFDLVSTRFYNQGIDENGKGRRIS